MLVQINPHCSINPKSIKTLQIINKGKEDKSVYSIQAILHDNSKHIVFSTSSIQRALEELQKIFKLLH